MTRHISFGKLTNNKTKVNSLILSKKKKFPFLFWVRLNEQHKSREIWSRFQLKIFGKVMKGGYLVWLKSLHAHICIDIWVKVSLQFFTVNYKFLIPIPIQIYKSKTNLVFDLQGHQRYNSMRKGKDERGMKSIHCLKGKA